MKRVKERFFYVMNVAALIPWNKRNGSISDECR